MSSLNRDCVISDSSPVNAQNRMGTLQSATFPPFDSKHIYSHLPFQTHLTGVWSGVIFNSLQVLVSRHLLKTAVCITVVEDMDHG